MANAQGVTDYQTAGSPQMVGSPTIGQVPLDPSGQPRLPFRIATLERADLIQTDSVTMTAAEQQLDRVVPGTGFVYGFELDYNVIAAGNSATVAFTEDAPYIAASSVIYRDVNGEIGNMDGFHYKLCARYGGWEPFNQESSTDTALWVAKVTGAGATGGSFRFKLKVPVALNRRTLLGLLGNQDRGQTYVLRANLGGSASIYSTAPTVLPPVVITRMYESYVVPNPVSDTGAQQQVIPPFYQVVPFLTKSISSNIPVGGSAINHYLQRLNTTFRFLILVFRSGAGTTPRATAESNMPTNITLKIGNQTIFTEPTWYRREKMYDRYGFDAPAGVLVYDFLHDFSERAGAELGHDWYWTQQLAEAQFIITYPSGFGSNAANSLTILTGDMVVPAGLNLYAS